MPELRHVAWISEGARPDGGAERYVFETAAHLRARGIRSTLLYDPGSPAPASLLDAFDGAFPLLETTRQLRELAPDVVYAHKLPRGVTEAQLTAAEIPVVRFFHDHQLFCLREHKYTAVTHEPCTREIGARCYACLGFVQKLAEAPFVRLRTVGELRAKQRDNHGFSAFVVGSRAMAQQLDLHGFPGGRVHVVPLYSSLPEPSEGKSRGDRLLYVGALTRGKGLDVLLRALFRVPSIGLDVVGRGPQEDEWRALVDDLGLGDRIAFLGSRPASEVAGMYALARAVVIPSRAPETFGLVGVEAMSHGAPTIASLVGGIGEWLEHEVTGLAVPPGDVDALAAAIDRLVCEPALAARLGASGREAHRTRFLPMHHVDRLVPILASAAAGGRP
jgi:glycosyltransferase involved in cell wall biosynthesis